MEKLIWFLNNLEGYLKSSNINVSLELPQLVVVGEQSCGKSSLLNGIIGMDVLPRGSGIVTRRPIILQVVHNKHPQEYGVIERSVAQTIKDFKELQKELTDQTNLLINSQNTVSREPIYLKVYSPNYINLTLIDLPGLTRISMNEQDIDVSDRVRHLVSEYITNPNSIIIAVIPAVIDIANSEALKLIKTVDQFFERTIGVMTKIDMMDEGTDCLAILKNDVVSLSLGWVGVVNRSHKDLLDGKSLAQALITEEEFFATHPAYRNIARRCGISFLRSKLEKLFKTHVNRLLPAIRQRILQQLRLCNSTIQHLQKPSGPSSNGNRARLIVEVSKEFSNKIRAQLGISQESLDVEKLSLGVKIRKILSDSMLVWHQNKKFNIMDIQTTIENAAGVPGFVDVPDVVIRSFIKNNIDSLTPYVMNVIQDVRSKLFDCVNYSLNDNCPYINLNNSLRCLTVDFLSNETSKAIKMMEFFMECEQEHINFRHPDLTQSSDGSQNSSRANCVLSLDEDSSPHCVVEIDSKSFKVKSKCALIKLTGNILSVYVEPSSNGNRSHSENELLGTIYLEDCNVMPLESTTLLNVALRLRHKTERYIMKRMKQLDIKFPSEDTMSLWKGRFQTLTENATNGNNEFMGVNPMLSIERIKKLVDRYTKIALKNIHDLMIKICHHTLICGLDSFLQSDLIYELLTSFDASELLYLDEHHRSLLEDYRKRQVILKRFLLILDTDLKETLRNS